jgi:hypothetical protein
MVFKKLFKQWGRCGAISPRYKARCILHTGHPGDHRSVTQHRYLRGRGYYLWNDIDNVETWHKLDEETNSAN